MIGCKHWHRNDPKKAPGWSQTPFSDHIFPKLSFSSRILTIQIVLGEKVWVFGVSISVWKIGIQNFSNVYEAKIMNFPFVQRFHTIALKMKTVFHSSKKFFQWNSWGLSYRMKAKFCLPCLSSSDSYFFLVFFFPYSAVSIVINCGTQGTIGVVEPVFVYPEMRKNLSISVLYFYGLK